MKSFFLNHIYTHGKAICFSMGFLLSCNAFAQNAKAGKIWYGVAYLGMASDTSQIADQNYKDDVVQEDSNSKRFLKDDISYYTLTFQDDNSWFKPIPQMSMDGDDPMSFYTNINETLKKHAALYTPTDENTKGHQYYRGISKKREFLNGEYDWQLKNEYKTILGYKCRRAECTKKWYGHHYMITAWFTDKIPVPDGPDCFMGLPGMILAVQYSGRYYYAKKIKLKDRINLHFPPEDRFLSFKEYIKRDLQKSGN